MHQEIVVSSTFMQNLFIGWGNVLGKSVYDVQNSLEVKILRHPFAATRDGADPPFVNIASFKIKDLTISS